MEQRELVKVLVQAVVLRREGDTIVGEATTEPRACYSQDDLAAFWDQAAVEVAGFNAMQQPPRRQRRQTKEEA
jgi:hypothetical protein